MASAICGDRAEHGDIRIKSTKCDDIFWLKITTSSKEISIS